MAETININTYPIQETITVNTVEDVTTINVNVIKSTGAVTSVNEQTGDVILTLGNLSNDVGYITLDDIPKNENVVEILASTPSNQFAYAHGTVTIGNKMIIGTRQGANSKLLRYSGTTLEESITVPCTVNGLECIVKKSDESRIYGVRYYNGVSYIWDADPLDFTDINYNVILGVNLQGSPAICTDETYIYGVTQGSAVFFKIRISDWSTVLTNSWTSRMGGHWCAINTVDGLFYATSSIGYLATVSTVDLSFTELDLTSHLQTMTDDNVYVPAEFNNFGYNALIVGGETKGNNTGLGACIVNVDTNTIYPFNILPTVGLWASNDYTKLYNTSNAGFIQVWDLQDIIWLVTVNQPYFNNTFTYRGNGFPNELLQPTDGFLYMTNWDTVNGTGVLSKIELTPVSQPIITQKEAYYNSLNSGNALASTDDLAEGATNLYFTNSRAVSALSSALSAKQDTLTASNTHTFVDGLTAMTTPVDADRMIIVDNSVSLAKKITWANIKATLKSYFDTVYTNTGAVATQITTALSSYATTSALTSGLATKQDTLVSATNIKTINSTSLLGSGNVSVEPTITAGTTSQYYRGDKSFQTLDKTAVGLANVDNTSDANKPVSTAQSTAIGLKEDTANKSTNVSTDQASNVKFPSVKSVYDWATGLFATKTMGAYSFRVNNTNATANSTETNFKQLPLAVLSTTPTFTAGTAPSGTTSHSTSGQYMGNVFFGKIDLNYSVAGATVTVVVVPLPSDWPTPIKPTGFTAASERIAIGVGFSATNTTGVTQSQYACILRSNSANNGFELVLSQASASSRYFHLTIAYPTA